MAAPKQPEKSAPFEVDLRLRLCSQGQVVFGKGVSELLCLCQEHHSLHMAAKAMAMSYRKALYVVRRAEEGFGRQILEKTIGGAGGGGSRLTPFGHQLVENFQRLEQELDQITLEKLREYLPDVDV